ncbi:MAG: putative transporter, MFS-type [Rubritepida sp.]|nr:putative transporter, MFS-type [Rubritepida sp.]
MRPAIFRGWRVVLGAFLVLMSGYGAIYSYAVFADDLAVSFGASRTSVSLVYALAGGGAFLVSAVAGPLADRIGPRLPAVAGMLLTGLGLALAGSAASFGEACLSYGLLVGVGVGLAYVPAVAAVQRWFVARRGLASGLAASGIGFGTAMVPALANTLAAPSDWRAALLALGLLVAVFGVTGALLLDASPEGLGLQPDGEDPGDAISAGATAVVEELTLATVWRSRRFGQLYLGVLLVSFPVSLPFAHLPRFAQDAGLSRTEALGLLELIGIGSILGRVLIGALADRTGREVTFLACCAGLSAATLAWSVAAPPGLAAFALVFGAFYGGFVVLLPAFVVDLFGRRSVAGIIGLLYTSRGLGLLVAPPAVALAAAMSGDGAWPLAASAVLGLAGTALLFRTAFR